MTNHELEYKLDRAIGTVTPDVYKDVTDQQTQYRTAVASEMDFYAPKKRVNKSLYALCSVAACACLTVGVLGYQNYFAVDSIIEIDVNPSISLSLNKQNSVLSAKGLNEDGAEILDEIKVKNLKLDTAIEVIMDEMVVQGYLDEARNAVLVTVENDKEERQVTIQETTSNAIHTTLTQSAIKPKVISQTTTKEKNVSAQELATRLGISYNKALLLLELTEKEVSLSVEEMAGMTIDAICDFYDDILDNLDDRYNDNHPLDETVDSLDDLLDDVEDRNEVDDDDDDINDVDDDDDDIDDVDDDYDDIDDVDDDYDDIDDVDDDYDDINDVDDDDDDINDVDDDDDDINDVDDDDDINDVDDDYDDINDVDDDYDDINDVDDDYDDINDVDDDYDDINDVDDDYDDIHDDDVD